MNLRQLRYFVAAIDAGSLTAAATSLGVSQPGLSLHLSNLERELGVKLLLRTARGVQPTEAGEACCRSARIALDELARMQAVASGGLGTPEVSLGLMMGWAPGLTVPIVAALTARQKSVRLRLVDGQSHELQEGVRTGALDAAVLYEAAPSSDLVFRPLFQQRLFAVGRAASQSGQSVSLRKLADRKLVLPPPLDPTRARLDRAFGAIGSAPVVAAEANTLAGVLSLVAAGAGEGVLAWAGPPDPAYRWSLIDDMVASQDVSLCMSRVGPSRRHVDAVTRIVAATVLEVVGSPEWAGAVLRGTHTDSGMKEP